MATLPTSECTYLASLSPSEQKVRIAALYAAGWSLSELASALDPPRPKTTVHYWVQNAPSQPVTAPQTPKPPRVRVPGTKARPINPQVPLDERPRLFELASLARAYRSGTPSTSPAAVANRDLTDRAVRLRSFGVPTAAIAEAAGVSYRAMARRIANAQ